MHPSLASPAVLSPWMRNALRPNVEVSAAGNRGMASGPTFAELYGFPIIHLPRGMGPLLGSASAFGLFRAGPNFPL